MHDSKNGLSNRGRPLFLLEEIHTHRFGSVPAQGPMSKMQGPGNGQNMNDIKYQAVSYT
jgi:hypothetical protein